jgi:two-component system phosphate regulon response regulator PhoB
MNSSVFTRHHGVLLAESDPDLRKLLHYWLELDGYDVLLAADGHELSQILDEGRALHPPFPDLLITDDALPLRDGLDVVETLRASDRRTPVVMLTERRDEQLKRRARAAGVNALVDKPVDTDDLRSVIALLVTRERRSAT